MKQESKRYILIGLAVLWRWILYALIPTIVLVAIYNSATIEIESAKKYLGHLLIFVFNHIWFCMWLGRSLLKINFPGFYLAVIEGKDVARSSTRKRLRHLFHKTLNKRSFARNSLALFLLSIILTLIVAINHENSR